MLIRKKENRIWYYEKINPSFTTIKNCKIFRTIHPVHLTADIKICKTHKNNLPQINADQRRNNLRNPATSAGNKNYPFTDPSLPFFRLGWCGNDNPSPRRTFHSIRRSGGFLVTFSSRKSN
jgi:hypothetical protein